MINEIVFLILALVAIISAIKMLNASELVHAVVYLGLVLAAVAGVYLTLGAEFLAAIQILIYVGAVVTLILFAVMLTTPASSTEGYGADKTPLSVLGIQAPKGMDVEALEDAPEHAATVREAEAGDEDAAQEPDPEPDTQELEEPDASEDEPDEDPADPEEPAHEPGPDGGDLEPDASDPDAEPSQEEAAEDAGEQDEGDEDEDEDASEKEEA